MRNLRHIEFFYEDTGAATNNNDTVYDKTGKNGYVQTTKIAHFTHHKTTDKTNQYISPIKNGIINLCHKKYINHQQNMIVDEKLAIKNWQANQDIIHNANKGGKIVIKTETNI